ncbi:MAG: ribosomal protein S18-alanine N-acetyltransferase [Holosporaceae bacterium]|jgi:ribosomal-protein-alanine N-acetyltransferase|nr:ribosomal protein S18-alanine N-acetyltransferase [Holosporaceae bacterium]
MIRQISEKDSGAVAEVHGRCFGSGWSERCFRDLLTQDVYIGFADVDNDTVRGFVLIQIVLDEAEMITFCVLPEFRSCGLGRSILTELTVYLAHRRVKKIFLEASEGNLRAIRLYESLGFERISRRSDYYRAEQKSKDALVMLLRLLP